MYGGLKEIAITVITENDWGRFIMHKRMRMLNRGAVCERDAGDRVWLSMAVTSTRVLRAECFFIVVYNNCCFTLRTAYVSFKLVICRKNGQ